MAYPWYQWLKPGNRFELVYNKHYVCSHTSMALMIRQRAAIQGVSVSVGNNKVGNGLIVDVRPKGQPMRTTKAVHKRVTPKKVFPANAKTVK